MKNKSNQELLSEHILEGFNILNHISYWSRNFNANTFEDSEKQKLSLKDYPIIIYKWNDEAKKLLVDCPDKLILSDFAEDDSRLISLKDVNTESDNGYRSREALADEKEFDAIAEQFATETNLQIIERIIRQKISALKAFLKQQSQDEETPQKNSIQIIEVLQKNNGHLEIFVNKNYNDEPIKPYGMGDEDSYWNKVAEIARSGHCDSREGLIKYFNSNKNNPLYKTLGYEKTKILTDGINGVEAEIEIKLITKEQINRSKGQRKQN